MMGVFNQLQEALGQHQQGDCKITPEADKFVNDYSDRVEAAKKFLQECQEQERKEKKSVVIS